MPQVLDPGLLDLAASAPADAEAAIEQLILPRFGAQPEPLQTDPRTYLHEVDDQRGAQTIQLLRNLAYLPPPARLDQEEIISAAAIEEAWNRWTADYRTNFAKANGAPDKVAIDTEATRALPENDRLRRALKACGSLEGEVALGEWPGPDDSLARRVLSFRLKLFGLDDTSDALINPDWPDLRLHLVRRARWVLNRSDNSGDALAIVNALGDAAALGKAAADQLRGWAVVLRIYNVEEQAASPLLPGRVAPPSVRARPDRGLPAVNAPDSGDRTRVLNLNDPLEDAQNELAVKIVQVRLWTLGYYPGAIDGSWGPVSDAALNRFIDDDPKDQARPDLRIATDDHTLLIVSPLLDAIAVHADAATGRLERRQIDTMLNVLRDGAARHAASLNQESGDLPPRQPPGTDPSADAAAFDAWSSLMALADQSPANLRPQDQTLASAAPPNGTYIGDDYVQEVWGLPERGEYQGWRGVFTAFGRLLRKIITKSKDFLATALKQLKKFARDLTSAAKAGLGYVHQIVRYVKNAARVAMRVVSLATARVRAWLGGTPVVTQAGPIAVATGWQFDFDTVFAISDHCPPSLLENHLRSLDWMARSFSIVSRIGLGVLKLTLALANWLLFAWRALGLIREIIAVSHDPLLRELFAEQAVV